jgi:hypothetical protein
MVKETEKSKSSVVSPAATLPAAVRTCKVCGAHLVHNNITGVCKDHRAPAKTKAKTNGAGDEHRGGADSKAQGSNGSNGAVVTKANGHGNGAVVAKAHGNGKAHELALEERVNLLISAIPLEEKVRMISSWLRAEL